MQNSKWCLFREKDKWVIRRWENGLYKRMSVKRYQDIRNNESELRAFLFRVNAAECKQSVQIKHAFISPELLDEYRELLEAQIPTKKNAVCQFNYLVEYFLNYFIAKLDLADPRQWYKVHKTKWAGFLLEQDLSASTIRKIVQEANRFMEFLADKRPDEVTAIRFKPISRARFRTLSAEKKLKKGRDRYIREEEWLKIEKNLPAHIKSAVCLCYYFGLRRSEALGLQLEDVRKEYLKVERQNLLVGVSSILKGRKKRKTPYWYGSPKLAYGLIQGLVPLSPDTLGEEWNKLNTGYKLHDLRATFITRALRDYNAREVQLAVGHEDLATTMRYAQDHRDIGDDIWNPEEAA